MLCNSSLIGPWIRDTRGLFASAGILLPRWTRSLGKQGEEMLQGRCSGCVLFLAHSHVQQEFWKDLHGHKGSALFSPFVTTVLHKYVWPMQTSDRVLGENTPEVYYKCCYCMRNFTEQLVKVNVFWILLKYWHHIKNNTRKQSTEKFQNITQLVMERWDKH